jgi:hypothetical protein
LRCVDMQIILNQYMKMEMTNVEFNIGNNTLHSSYEIQSRNCVLSNFIW